MRASRCLTLLFASACASTGPAFRATDPTFTPRPGPTPRVFVERADVPDVALRSVGIIEVKARSREGAIERAAAKGAELGCWALIEHHVFVYMNQARLVFGARVYLAHGTAPHVESIKPLTVLELHCVVRDESQRVPRA
jgi:hypothetical protein